MLLDGLFIPLTTPFYADGASYWRKLEHNVARYSQTPAAGMVGLGPWSEAAGLSDEERHETLRIVGETAAKEKVLIAGAAAESVRGALTLAEHAAEARFDAVLVRAPMEWRRLVRGKSDGSLAQVEMFFRAVADRAALPVVLWSDASFGGLALPVEMVSELAAHANVIGMVDAGLTAERFGEIRAATKDVKHEVTVTTVFAAVTRRMLEVEREGEATFVPAQALSGGGASVAVAPPKPAIKTRTKTVGFQMIAAGRASEMAPLLEAGVAGAMPEVAACAPQGCHEVWAAFKDGDPELARLKAARLKDADEVVDEFGVAGVKYACDLNGYFGGAPRLPRVGLTAEERMRVETALREVRN
ncbi:MAG TPA: dihydrodipicolinate synthase family protein [Acidobacteriaceae bacterium]|jgi:dihydrodipicolinate synthase/N-acetylneuraminate lyase|nr:dihydrodipicolinate synthase family protein [Acidobacteriaceae bacterium]